MKTTHLILLAALACVSTALAVDPPPDGGYPDQNTAEGEDALFSLTSGTPANTAIGFNALYSDTTGNSNVGIGSQALFSNTTGTLGTAVGWGALYSNTYGYGNSAFGGGALYNNTTGDNNTASGHDSLFLNTTGANNVAVGVTALTLANGSENVAVGYATLYNVAGVLNTAIGHEALRFLESGNNNIALGQFAGAAVINGSNNIIIGDRGGRFDNGAIRIGRRFDQIGKTFVAGINGTTVADGVGVIIDRDGHLGTVNSSARYKDAIQPMDKASEAILALKPVTFRYKHELDPDGIPQFGLVAEDVEKVNPDLVARDEQGKPYTVRYEAVNAMLLNEFLKGHKAFVAEQRKVQEQGATIAEFKKEIANLTATVKQQSAQIQKVSAQLEVSKRTPQTVANNQ